MTKEIVFLISKSAPFPERLFLLTLDSRLSTPLLPLPVALPIRQTRTAKAFPRFPILRGKPGAGLNLSAMADVIDDLATDFVADKDFRDRVSVRFSVAAFHELMRTKIAEIFTDANIRSVRRMFCKHNAVNAFNSLKDFLTLVFIHERSTLLQPKPIIIVQQNNKLVAKRPRFLDQTDMPNVERVKASADRHDDRTFMICHRIFCSRDE